MENSKTLNKSILFLLVVIVGVVLSGCGSTAVTTMDIVLTEWGLEPQSEVLNAGLVTFNITNNGALEHNFFIEGKEDQMIELIFPGETKTLEIELEPGTYTVLCSLAGHQEAGMQSTITVSE